MLTFIQLANEVMPQRDRDGIRGLDREVSRMRCHILTAAFAEKDITQITSLDIREWLRAMAQKDALGPGKPRKLSRQTINRCQSLVSAVFAEAVERELIPTNPCMGVKLKKRVDESDTEVKWAYLTIEEQRALFSCEALPLADRLMIRFAIGTGLRQGEQRHLELPDLVVDGDDPHVVVRIAGRRKGKKLPPKSGKIRRVPLFGDALVAAREWLELLPSFCPNNPENLVFPTRSGRLRLHWHALRHTFATNLVSGVIPGDWKLHLVQELMGHSNVLITQRYAHVGEDAIKRAVREAEAAAASATAVALAPVPAPVVETEQASVALAGIFGRFASRAKRAVESVVATVEEVRHVVA